MTERPEQGEPRFECKQMALPHRVTGSKHIPLVRALALIALVGLIIWALMALRQRTYNGKPESYWINNLAKQPNPTTVVEHQADRKEWQALGTQAISILITALEMNPGPMTKPYANLWPQLPTRLQNVLPPPTDYERLHSVAWAKLSTQTNKVSVPFELVARALKDQHWPIRNNALVYLNQTVLPKPGSGKDQFLPLLIRTAEDVEVSVRMIAVLCLGHYAEQPRQVIPNLTNALEDPYPDVRIRAAMALNRIDASAHEARVKEVAYNCLNSQGVHGSGALAAQFVKKLERSEK